MRISRRLTASALGLAAIVSVAVSAAPAQAAQNDCPSTAMCIFVDENYNYTPGKFYSSGTPDLRNYAKAECGLRPGAASNWNDCTSSVFNRNSRRFGLYFDINYGGGSTLTVNPGQAFNLNLTWNDKVSSLKPL